MPDDPNIPPAKPAPLRGVVQAESILQLALAIPAGCFVGLGIGYLLDRHFHTKWIAVTLLFMGAAGGFIQLFSFLARSAKRGDQ
jgi:F0F1-type ATP synthase assembly protein I